MANVATDIKPVISTVSGGQPHTEGEMDALLLGRTRVSWRSNFMLLTKFIKLKFCSIKKCLMELSTEAHTLYIKKQGKER